ncbi:MULTISPECIES: hypothetical protein [Paenibacillus]|nr:MULTISPECIES: hypothetical protein [Paenibacillus]
MHFNYYLRILTSGSFFEWHDTESAISILERQERVGGKRQQIEQDV